MYEEQLNTIEKIHDIIQVDDEPLVEIFEMEGKEYIRFYNGTSTVYLSNFVLIKTNKIEPQARIEYKKFGVFIGDQIAIYVPTNIN